jgi:hypothetical protein
LADPHWSAFTPFRPLRRYRLVDMEGGYGLTNAALRIDERILHFLAGVNLPDARLEGLLQNTAFPHWIADEHKAVAIEAAGFLAGSEAPPALHFCGDDPLGQEDTAAFAAAAHERQLLLIRAESLPVVGTELDQLKLLLERETLLLPGAVLIQCGSNAVSAADAGEPGSGPFRSAGAAIRRRQAGAGGAEEPLGSCVG